MRRAARSVSLTLLATALLVVPLGGIAVAGENGGGQGNGNGSSGGTQKEGVATLKVERPAVEVKAKGADDFEPATDGQQLRAGDTVRTDDTGRAEIDYSAGSYTRLDVNTTFKIVKLTEDQGQREVEGGLESGRTWNRAQDVTESGSFEQSGGGATAAVTGTAFAVECTSLSDCTYMAIVDVTDLTGKDGEKRTLTPLTECDSDDGALCDEVSELTPEEIAANAWIQENLLRDLLERGYGPGPFVVGGVLRIVDGVITFEETPQPPASTTTTTQPKPALEADPLECEVLDVDEPPCDYAALGGAGLEPTSEIVVYEGDYVRFRANIVPNGATGVSIVFDEIPTDLGQFCLESDLIEGSCAETLIENHPYDATDFFIFIAECYGCEGPNDGVLKFHLVNSAGSSPPAQVPITVEPDYYECGGEVVTGCGVESTSSAPSTSPATTSPTTAPSTTSTTGPSETTTSTSSSG